MAMRMIQVEHTDVILERGLSEVLGMPRSTLMLTVPGLEGMGFVHVRPGEPGVHGESRPSLFSWDPARLREWLAGWCDLGHNYLPRSLIPGSTGGLRDHRHEWPRSHHPICQPRWSTYHLGTVGWQITEVAQEWDRPFGVREMAREISRRWEYGADHTKVLRCLTKMAKADPILRVEATKADGRWTVKAWVIAPYLVKSQLSHYVETDELAHQIALRHQEEIAAHRKPPPRELPERPQGFLRGPEGAKWAMRAWLVSRPGETTTRPSQAKPPPTPEPVSTPMTPEELKEMVRNMFSDPAYHYG